MKKTSFFLLFSLIFTLLLQAQPSTEVYLFNLSNKLKISDPVNISNNPEAYDNQPSFLNNNTLLFSSTRNGQTDIREVNLKSGENRWISNTENGSEYSPLKIPQQNAVSSIRLDKDGKQLLYSYDLDNGNPKVIVPDLVIGYHVWFNKNNLVSFVLGEQSSLVVSNLKNKTNYTYQKNIGRSLHKIPGTSLISYISKEKESWEIKSLNPISGKTELIVNTPKGAEDMCWTPNGTILMGKEDKLWKFNPETDTNWIEIASLSNFNLKDITRLAVSPDGSKIAIVVSESEVKEVSLFNNNTIQLGVVVSNLKRSLDFYKNIIGMKEVGELNLGGSFGKSSGLTGGLPLAIKILKLEDAPEANQLKLVSFNTTRKKSSKYIQDDNGVQYITIFVNSVKPFLKRLSENNITLLGETPIKLADGRSFVLFQDPDGTFIELIGGE